MSVEAENTLAYVIARECAYLHAGEQSYLPASREEAEVFQPHPWVITALVSAFRCGIESQKQKPSSP